MCFSARGISGQYREEWTIDYKSMHNINSLRHLSEFELFLMKLTQNYTKVILDSEGENEEVEVEARAEADFY